MFDPTVRAATATDHEELRRLEAEARAALVDARGGARWLAENPPVGARWTDLVARDEVAMFVADLDGAVVGLLVETFHPDGTAKVAGVYVETGARECGFGDALMEGAIAAARAHGSARIEGEALPGDRETKNLYERAKITARLIIVSSTL